MFETLRCVNCGLLRLSTAESVARDGYDCAGCGGSAFRNPAPYSWLERIRLAWWCVRENAREGNMRTPWDYWRAFRIGMKPVLPEGQ